MRLLTSAQCAAKRLVKTGKRLATELCRSLFCGDVVRLVRLDPCQYLVGYGSCPVPSRQTAYIDSTAPMFTQTLPPTGIDPGQVVNIDGICYTTVVYTGGSGPWTVGTISYGPETPGAGALILDPSTPFTVASSCEDPACQPGGYIKGAPCDPAYSGPDLYACWSSLDAAKKVGIWEEDGRQWCVCFESSSPRAPLPEGAVIVSPEAQTGFRSCCQCQAVLGEKCCWDTRTVNPGEPGEVVYSCCCGSPDGATYTFSGFIHRDYPNGTFTHDDYELLNVSHNPGDCGAIMHITFTRTSQSVPGGPIDSYSEVVDYGTSGGCSDGLADVLLAFFGGTAYGTFRITSKGCGGAAGSGYQQTFDPQTNELQITVSTAGAINRIPGDTPAECQGCPKIGEGATPPAARLANLIESLNARLGV